MSTVDVHAHCVPSEVLDRLRTQGGALGLAYTQEDGADFVTVGTARRQRVRPGLTDVTERLAAMDAAGVDAQILSPWMTLSASSVASEHAVAYAQAFNDALARVVLGQPTRLAALANLPLQDPAAGAAELRRAVVELGLVGAEIATRPAGRELDDPALEVLWSTAEELGCLLLVHPHDSLAGRGVNRHFLNNTVGNPAESTIALGHLIFGGVVERHPGVRFVFVHGGGFAPYQIGRWDHAYRNDARGAAANLTRLPSEWLRTMYFDTVVHSPQALRHLVDTVGADRVLLGSDYPFEMGEPRPVETVIGNPGLEEDQAARILSGNVRGLLGPLLPEAWIGAGGR